MTAPSTVTTDEAALEAELATSDGPAAAVAVVAASRMGAAMFRKFVRMTQSRGPYLQGPTSFPLVFEPLESVPSELVP